MDELSYIQEAPCLIVGDLNAELADLLTLSRLTSTGWTDLGSSAALWGEIPSKPTCRAPSSRANATVRDNILASPQPLSIIKGFSIVDDHSFVHTPSYLAA